MATHGPFTRLLTPRGRKTTAEQCTLFPPHFKVMAGLCVPLTQTDSSQPPHSWGLLGSATHSFCPPWHLGVSKSDEGLGRHCHQGPPVIFLQSAIRCFPGSCITLASGSRDTCLVPSLGINDCSGEGSGLSQEKLSFSLTLYRSPILYVYVWGWLLESDIVSVCVGLVTGV